MWHKWLIPHYKGPQECDYSISEAQVEWLKWNPREAACQFGLAIKWAKLAIEAAYIR
jgi:hypothetical protein